MNESAYYYGGFVCLSVCLSVTFVDHAQSFERSLRVGRIICSIHPVIRKTKPDKKIPPVSFPFPVPNVEGVGKNLKISCPMMIARPFEKL
jgi:hypothetical protein